ncbi:MAG TPA: hypothetical protein VFN61_12875 [Acidimicrobiales bacterium]|nr:hypothetical protein [Acidimicrobiales bacterium]
MSDVERVRWAGRRTKCKLVTDWVSLHELGARWVRTSDARQQG